MKSGSVLVDISIDQGGCFEDSHPTTHADPTYRVHDSVFYCVANMPGAVPHTSTYALTNVTLPYVVEIANRGWREALRRDPSFAPGLNAHEGSRDLCSGRGSARTAGLVPGGGAQLTTFARAIGRYLDHLAVERGLAEHTLQAYRRDLERYAATLTAAGRPEIEQVSTKDVADFLAGLREGDETHPPLAASSAGRAVVAVRGLHAFAVAEGLTAVDPARAVRPPPPPRRLPKAISVSEVERLLDAAGIGPAALRDRALLELLYGTGARISEAVGLDVDDLELSGESRSASVAAIVRLNGKGGKQRLVPVGRFARDAVDAYLVRARPGARRRIRPRAAEPGALPQRSRRPADPPGCLGHPAGRGRPGRPGGGVAARAAPLLRYPSARWRRRRARGPGTAWPRVGHHDAGLHAGHGRQAARGLRIRASARNRLATAGPETGAGSRRSWPCPSSP